MFFQIYQPDALLKPYIDSIWILEKDEMPEKAELVLPDGCMELIFHYGDAYITDIMPGNDVQPLNIIVGQIKKAISLLPTGKSGIISVRFHPWGFYTLTGIPASRFSSIYKATEEIFGEQVEIISKHLAVANHEDKVSILSAFLHTLLEKRKEDYYNKYSHYIQSLQKLIHNNGNLQVAALAAMCNVSVRQYSRIINTITGLSPKRFARIIRLHAFLNVYNKKTTLTKALFTAGYFDQAHFIKEFKDISSYTPSEFFKGDNAMAELMIF